MKRVYIAVIIISYQMACLLTCMYYAKLLLKEIYPEYFCYLQKINLNSLLRFKIFVPYHIYYFLDLLPDYKCRE